MPAYHGNGLDELACFVLPLVLLGVMLLVIMRRNPQFEDEELPNEGEPVSDEEDVDPPHDP